LRWYARGRVTAVHCPECSFANSEGASYCQKCGAYIGDPGEQQRESTATYRIDQASGELVPVEIDELVDAQGAALVIRSGGGRVGESFALRGERMGIGRGPDNEIFLDDITVSRNHALFVRRGSSWFIDDLGSLNGSYVNRRRVDSQELEDGDELQIGKFKLTFFSR
jgi:hypothetical protein